MAERQYSLDFDNRVHYCSIVCVVHMRTKKEIIEELNRLRGEEAEERKELIDSLNSPRRAECMTDEMNSIAITEAQCEILEWVISKKRGDD